MAFTQQDHSILCQRSLCPQLRTGANIFWVFLNEFFCHNSPISFFTNYGELCLPSLILNRIKSCNCKYLAKEKNIYNYLKNRQDW